MYSRSECSRHILDGEHGATALSEAPGRNSVVQRRFDPFNGKNESLKAKKVELRGAAFE
jgi:hypothetical protein